ncbi:hypothetical protein F4805DRAFT_464768 [Annulohypoxylon moriforme]|nr:hypothetical protein F4805DRAFT_464768 [Annulohypoxylon moriforme]
MAGPQDSQPSSDSPTGTRGNRPSGGRGDAPSSSSVTPSNQNVRGGRGQRGTRGSRRGGNSNVRRTTLATPRSFGGHLTTGTEADESGATNPIGLNIDAPEFIPGQPIPQSINNPANQRQSKSNASRRAPKSTADDLSTRIHEDINNGQYECVICTNEVLPNSNIWSCAICWTVAHLACVKKWFANRARTPDEEQSSWRCPGCNSTLEDPPEYSCWCGKEPNPKSIPGLNPHSCGQPCLKTRKGCLHPCHLPCHAGPCPPCIATGPTQPCRCGRHTSTRLCRDTDYGTTWSCHEICGELLTCGQHECQQECHSDYCGDCEVPVLSICFCGREVKEIPCIQRTDKRPSYNHGQLKGDISKNNDLSDGWYLGCFKCDSICGRAFDCGKHHCEKECHPQDATEAHCPSSPDMITHCPCGKTALADFMSQPRESCEDPIPSCGKICNRPLSCGHFCEDACHTGTCRPCTQKIDIICKCGRTATKSVCHQGKLEKPDCMRICHVQLNCGRHEHSERCCPAEKKAAERLALKKKSSRHGNHANEEVEPEHICLRTCGRLLKCGKHNCEQLCHKGACSSCPEAIFEDLKCHCGRTVLQPPLPCGTRPPPCRFECTRFRACGHPQVSHNCHLDEEPCPKCPFLVEKSCICGKKMLKNQPCWFEEPRCGLPCDRKLKCGAHTCEKTCHRPGECEDAGSRCSQPCGKIRTCGHSDVEQCHAPYPCKEDKPCQAKTFLTCECQRRKQEVKCMATKKNPSPDRGTLACDDECLRLKRNALLAEALSIDPQTHTDDHVPYSETTLNFYKEFPQFAQTYEREFRVFATDPGQKLLRLKPMKSHQRAFLHSLAEDFGFDSQSADPEPHRHVCLFKTPRFVSAPMKTIAQSLNIKPPQQSTSAQQSTWVREEIPGTQPFNALILSAPKFGLTIEELDSALKKQYAVYPYYKFDTDFLPDTVIIRGSGAWRPQDLETVMSALKPVVLNTVTSLGYAKRVSLCHVDDELNILRSEKESGRTDDKGWSAVIRRSSRPTTSSTPTSKAIPVRNTFIALKKKTPKQEKKPVEEEVEDWEKEAEKMGDDE